MRNPNGYGAIVRLGGKRRKPYAVRITAAYELDAAARRVTQKYKYLGYYAKRADAIRALAEYNASPYDPDIRQLTVSDIYRRWSGEHFSRLSGSTVAGYRSAWKLLAPLYDMPMREVRLMHLQRAFDASGKTRHTQEDARNIMHQLFEYAIKNDIAEKNYASYIDLSNAPASIRVERAPFTSEDIAALWQKSKTSEAAGVILMLIYTGVRVGELLELKKDKLDLPGRCFEVTHSKTAAGLRRVPIAEKIVPFFEYWLNKNASPWLLTNRQKKPFVYQSFLKFDWTETLRALGLENHRPHDTRHTCISLLSMAAVQPELIRAIVGHKGQNLTEDIYTHFDFRLLIDAINKI